MNHKILTQLVTGNTCTFSDNSIGENTVCDVFFSDDNVYAVSQEVRGNTIDITLSEHSSPVGVALVIDNLTDFTPNENIKDSDVALTISAITPYSNQKEFNEGLMSSYDTIYQDTLQNTVDIIDLKEADDGFNTRLAEVEEVLSEGVNAENVYYDNEISGLSSSTVQGAIDELAQGGSTSTEWELIFNGVLTKGQEITIDYSKYKELFIKCAMGYNDSFVVAVIPNNIYGVYRDVFYSSNSLIRRQYSINTMTNKFTAYELYKIGNFASSSDVISIYGR